jgi:hypothetical protein
VVLETMSRALDADKSGLSFSAHCRKAATFCFSLPNVRLSPTSCAISLAGSTRRREAPQSLRKPVKLETADPG